MSIAFATTSYWSVELRSGKELSEARTKVDFLKGESRQIDWTRELVGTGDVFRIKTLRLHCPNGEIYGLEISERETAFQLKVAAGVPGYRGVLAQFIGKVTDKDTGACTCHVWDNVLGKHLEWKSNVHNMGSWAPHIDHIGPLHLPVLGLEEG